MVHVIYKTATTKLFRKANGDEFFKSEADARRYITRCRLGDEYAVADYDTYRASIERQVERVNLMSGQKYMESINTPNYMSPASEAYWAM